MAGLDSLTLHTVRLRLRPLCDGDAAALLAIFSDPRVMRYWSTPPWAGLEQAQAFIARSHEEAHSGDALRLGIEHEGVLRERWIVAGEVSDSALYGLLAREWQARP